MENKKPVIVGIGELLWDVLPTGKRAGGAPVNFVYHATQLGAEGYAISAVGNDLAGTEILQENRGYGSASSSTDVDRFRRFLPDVPGFSKSTNHESRPFAFQRDSENQPLLGCETAICTERKFLYEPA